MELVGLIMGQWGLIGCQWCSVESIGVCGARWGLGGGSVCNVYTPMENFSSFYMKESTP